MCIRYAKIFPRKIFQGKKSGKQLYRTDYIVTLVTSCLYCLGKTNAHINQDQTHSPGIDNFKSRLVSQVKHDNHSVRPTVIGFGDGLVSLLASRVPDTQSDAGTIPGEHNDTTLYIIHCSYRYSKPTQELL